jgi:glutathione synthase/RimK-type ligase-like ATP-grasp enzyme
MSDVRIIVDNLEEWEPYYPSKNVISTTQYINSELSNNHFQLINLSNDMKYLGVGYYCSLLAESRKDKALPSVSVINDLIHFKEYQSVQAPITKNIAQYFDKECSDNQIKVKFYFGQSNIKILHILARKIFEQYSAPILVAKFIKLENIWILNDLELGDFSALTDQEQTEFAESLNMFSKKIWRRTKARKTYRYDMAILVNPDEKLCPSNKKAIKKFQQAGKEMGVDIELIGPGDINKVSEYDSLFIRENTTINHHTYQFAVKAQNEGIIVIDSPESIIRCTNKVYLHNLLSKHNIPTPKSKLLMKHDNTSADELIEELGLPVVVKIPDGSFSKGVKKANSSNELQRILEEMFHHSSVILAQKYYYTDYDWRIGVLNGRAIYASKYYMAPNHWQIVNHNKKNIIEGDAEALGIQHVPKDIIKIALKAAKLIGNDLYGVDVKVYNDFPLVIEVNDNPSLDAGYEDAYLGDELYRMIISEFVRRMDSKR